MDFKTQFNDLSKAEDIAKLTSKLSELADSLDILYSTAAPNGSISGRQGQLCLYNNSGSYEVWICTTGSTVWQQVGSQNVTKFLVQSEGQNNIASVATITFGTEIFDVGNNFASNTFTSPATGKYQLSVQIQFIDIDSASTNLVISLVTSNRTYVWNINPSADLSADSYATAIISVCTDMDINDTAYVAYSQTGGASQTYIVAGNASFSGFLVN